MGAFRGERGPGYDGVMRKPSLTLDTFAAALAVLGASSATASIGCSKAERAPAATIAPAPEPPSAASAAAPAAASPSPGLPSAAEPAAQAAPPAPIAAPKSDQAAPADPKRPPAAASKTSGNPVGATAVDGGRGVADEKKKPAGMTCGAGMCSADMKKGN